MSSIQQTRLLRLLAKPEFAAKQSIWNSSIVLSFELDIEHSGNYNVKRRYWCRAAWEQQDVSDRSLRENWTAIWDRRWAVASCLERTADFESGQRALLEAALLETEAKLATLQDTGESSSLSPERKMKQRL